MSLSRDQRRASRELGLTIDSAAQQRLALHGYQADGFGCYARPGEAPRSLTHALAVCVEEAAEPVAVGLPRDQRGEGADQAGEQGGGAGGGHAPMYAPGRIARESDR